MTPMDDAIREVAAIRARLAAIEAAVNGGPKPTMNELLRAARSDRRAPSEPPHDADLRRQAIVAAATAARFRNPSLAGTILAGRDGEPAALIRELADAEPYLVTPSMNELIRRAARGERT